MIAEAFLSCALSLPLVAGFHGNVDSNDPTINYTAPRQFRAAQVEVIRMLRDYPNGGTGSRPQAWTLVYGKHPHWVSELNYNGVRAVGAWIQKTRWPFYVQSGPYELPFPAWKFQVYIFDDFPGHAHGIVKELNRIVRPEGFFLYRYTKNGVFGEILRFYQWERWIFDFEEFSVWRRKIYWEELQELRGADREDLQNLTTLESSA